MLWDSLTKLTMWTLPTLASLPPDSVMVFDGWWMSVELRYGNHYRSFGYGNPDAHKHPTQQLAARIGRAPQMIWRLVPEPARIRTYRGRLDLRPGRVGSFTACGSTERWGVSGELGTLWSFPEGTDTATVRSRLAEVRGMLAAPGLAVMWRSPYNDVLQVRSVTSSSEWTDRSC